jgi:type I restriction enzyme R subunit
MTSQSEQILEEKLIQQLASNGYEKIIIKDEKELIANLKTQLEKHNNKTFTDSDFKQILTHLTKSNNVFEKALLLRDKFSFRNENNELVYVEFINMDFWCQNQYQVTHQITNTGHFENRYDVTLLINGLPLVQIELKKTGLELKEAYNQIVRYQKHSFGANTGLFNFVQLFVISNGVNTKYYSNFGNKKPDFKQTFYWTDDHNKRISKLEDFANTFLEKCHISKMITKYIVMHDTDKVLMVLRPYQFNAVEKIIDRVKNSNKNGYIWHTTGSGKTLTSFKASQILSQLPKVDKVVFCVDRQDLDYQTAKEFNAFKPDCIDMTNNTSTLVSQFNDSKNPLIVTTIQKLYNAITKEHHLKTMNILKDKKIVFIFDECHRSQFGDTHKKITQYFSNYQLFGFTGTPIFVENSLSKSKLNQTTASLFGEQLHKYVITDAIKDENVLKFSVEYVGKYREKNDSHNEIDIEVEAIDTQELMESEQRVEKIAKYIIQQHPIKTHNKEFTAMFCVSNVEMLIKYMETFRRLQEEEKNNLKIATIFSYGANDEMIESEYDEKDFNEVAEDRPEYNAFHKRDKLEEYIQNYNKLFNTPYTTKDSKSFYNYYHDIARRVRNKDIDLLVVVNMFLTGFDSKPLNTLFVDKNLKYHGLIQAYSRTNRIYGEKKSQGNIIVFRNLKKATDDAIALFSNKEAKEIIIMQPYVKYVKDIDKAFEDLLKIAPTFESVDELLDEYGELEFVKAFRNIIRLKNIISSYVDFTFDDIEMDEQTFENYKSKYLDLHDKTAQKLNKTSFLEEVDFELELIHRDDITVAYILGLLAKLKSTSEADRAKKQKEILDLVAGESKLRSKRKLIEKFITENLPFIDEENIEEAYNIFMDEEKIKAFNTFTQEENIDPDKLKKLTETYLFTQRTPKKEEVTDILNVQPSIFVRSSVGDSLINKFLNFVNTFFRE